MNWKRFWLTFLAVFVLYMILDMILHLGLLGGIYDDLAHLWRPDAEMQKLYPLMWLGTLVFTFMFVFLFAKGYEGRGLGEGARFGFYIGLLLGVPMALGSYAMYPLPFTLAMYWLIGGLVEMILAGILASMIYRPKVA
jgi:hypothetical protein